MPWPQCCPSRAEPCVRKAPVALHPFPNPMPGIPGIGFRAFWRLLVNEHKALRLSQYPRCLHLVHLQSCVVSADSRANLHSSTFHQRQHSTINQSLSNKPNTCLIPPVPCSGNEVALTREWASTLSAKRVTRTLAHGMHETTVHSPNRHSPWSNDARMATLDPTPSEYDLNEF